MVEKGPFGSDAFDAQTVVMLGPAYSRPRERYHLQAHGQAERLPNRTPKRWVGWQPLLFTAQLQPA